MRRRAWHYEIFMFMDSKPTGAINKTIKLNTLKACHPAACEVPIRIEDVLADDWEEFHY